MINVHGYPAEVWRRFVAPASVGQLSGDAVLCVDVGSPASRAQLRLWARVEGARLAEVRFQALGCPVTVAVGQWLAETLQGRTAVDPGNDIGAACRAALEIGDDKAHCWIMAEDAVRALARAAQED